MALMATLVLGVSFVCSSVDDWLVTPPTTPVTLTSWSGGLQMSNGLITRSFAVTSESWATWDFTSHLEDTGDSSLLRALTPESIVTLDGVPYNVGGLVDASCSSASSHCDVPPGAFLNRSVTVKPDPTAYQYTSHQVLAPEAPFAWTPGARGSPPDVHWPPQGLHLVVEFRAPANAPIAVAATTVKVHYEMRQQNIQRPQQGGGGSEGGGGENHPGQVHAAAAAGIPRAKYYTAEGVAPPYPKKCDGVLGCGGCPGALFMRACSTAKTTAESQDWSFDNATKTMLNGGMCLSAAGANTGGSSGCVHLAPCNATLSAQRWELTSDDSAGTNAGWLRSLDPSTCGGPTPPGCCAGVTANSGDAGAWLNDTPCGPAPDQQQFGLIGTHLVETLALNQPYSPMPFQAYAGQGDAGLDSTGQPRYKGDGKLHVELEYEYSDVVNWGFEPQTYSGASEPTLSTQFDPVLATPVPHVNASTGPFISFRTYLLVLDDGAEQGGLQNPIDASSENDGGCSL
eukprot:gene2435-1094_t